MKNAITFKLILLIAMPLFLGCHEAQEEDSNNVDSGTDVDTDTYTADIDTDTGPDCIEHFCEGPWWEPEEIPAECLEQDFCLDGDGQFVDGCLSQCGGISGLKCPHDDLVCLPQPFGGYDGGTICLPPTALACEAHEDCQHLPSQSGCEWEHDECTYWRCKNKTCTPYCRADSIEPEL